MTTNGGLQLKASVARWRQALDGKMEALARQTVQEMASRVVRETPVDIGFLAGSWQPTLGKPAEVDTATPEKGGAIPSPADSLARISLVIAGMKLGDRYCQINNAAYALRVEYGFTDEDSLGRQFNQRGQFYTTRTVKTWPQVVDAVARDLAK